MVNPFERVTVASVNKHLPKFQLAKPQTFDYIQKKLTYMVCQYYL